ncbi:MAG: glycosyltransferase family 4 protein [Nitrososphaerota archaeon]
MLRVMFTASGKHIGGATMAMIHLILGLASIRKVEPILLSTPPRQDYLKLYKRLLEKNVKIVFSRYVFRSSLLYWVWLFFSSLKTIKRFRIDIVHCHGTKEALIVGLAAKLLRRKIVYTVEGDPILEIFYSPQNYSMLDKIILKFSWMLGLRLADVVVGCSNWMANYLKKKYGIEAIGIHNPIDYERFSKIEKHGSNIVCVARFEKVKGLETLLKAVPKIIEVFPNIKVVLVGGGAEEEFLRKMMEKLSISKNVEFQAFRSDIERVFEDAAIFVLPSIYEPFGMAAAEALASGIPIIVSRTGGLREIVEENVNGFSFNTGDWRELSEKLLLLLRDSRLREEMSRAARTSAKKFSSENIALKYLQTYLFTLKGLTRNR